ncbi:MAG TPA: isoprenylcysteine carboxylmethyltransferase family protein, partial [Chloroflexota bacterium]|nr:isoprenylcysteine carboxylmethyltransferase family protein [Chloroflexota bacterium]
MTEIKVRPPVVAVLWLVGSEMLGRLVPGLGQHRLPIAARVVGIAPLGAGATLGVWALGWFRRRETTFEPFGTPAALVESGPYQFTRNPMYLGLVLMLAGVALIARRAPLLLAPLGFMATMNVTQIPREEALLEREFGESFRAYRQRVRRW